MITLKKKIFAISLSTIISVFFFQTGIAEVWNNCDFNSAPTSEESGGVYTCTTGSTSLQVSDDGGSRGGCGMDHVTTEGWNGSGGAKFCLPTSAPPQGGGSYRRLSAGPLTPDSASQMNIRWLMYMGPGVGEKLSGKWHDNNSLRGSMGIRMFQNMIGHASYCGADNTWDAQPEISFNSTLWIGHAGGATGPCEGYQFCEGDPTCTIGNYTAFDLSDHEGEWVAYEWERKSDGVVGIYIWTEDGTYNGMYYSYDTTYSGTVGRPDLLMPYLQTSNPGGEYFIIDEMVVADTFIGPPAGFVQGESPSPVPVIHNISTIQN